MPPLKPGKIVSQTGKVVSAAPKVQPKSNKGESAQAASSNAKAIAKAATPNARESRVEDSKKQQAAKPFKNSLPSLNSNFKGVGVVPYLDKNGNVPSVGTQIKNSSGPSETGGGSNNDYNDTNSQMDATPTPDSSLNISEPVRIATRNVTDISSLVPQFDAEQIQKLLFENISAIELSLVERHDTIEGINQRYSIISNLSEIRKKYDAGKQLSAMDKFKPLTSIYAINIQDKIPQEDYVRLEKLDSTYQYLDENNQIVTREKGTCYIDTNGDLVIELINLERNQQVEVQIDTNGTIYKIDKVEL
jgi:hypothetical protein